MTKDERDCLDEIVEILNCRGHASIFARRGPITKELVEVATAREWGESMQNEFGRGISQIQHSGTDHPDCYALYNDKKIGLELTELVNESILKSEARKRHASASTEVVSSFDDAQWSYKKLSQELSRILAKKSRKYSKAGMRLDVLIIHTDEDWLSPFDVEKWLTALEIETPSNIGSAYLLRSYFPGYRDWWPIFNLYGDL